VAFFAIYILFAFGLNLAWKAGWRIISPPHDRRAEEEPEITDSFS
jgi:hypothetical protein